MEDSKISIRFSRLSDLIEMQKLFVETISAICVNDYSPEQIKVWISSVEDSRRWIDKITSQHFLVALSDNKIVGYASLENDDYLDFLYVHKDYQRQGIGDRLYTESGK